MKKEKMTLFFGGPIVTVSEVKYAEAVLTSADKICCVGSLEKCRAYAREARGSSYEEYNLQSKTLLPGFIDIHAHPMMLGMGCSWVDLSFNQAKSIDDIVALLREQVAHSPKGSAIKGFGYNHRTLVEKRHPLASDLDRVSTDRPVQIMHHSGHSNVVNHYFLRLCGITKETPDPAGGTIGRDENGQPDGVLFDSAADYLTDRSGIKIANHGPNIHMPDDAPTLQKILALGQSFFIENGITACNDIQVTKQEMESYLEARDSGLLKIRVGLSFLSSYLEDIMKMGFKSTVFGEGRLFFGPLKLYSDGALNAGTAAMTSAYKDGVKDSGFLYHERQELIDMVTRAHAYGLQCACHANGDAAIENVILAYEEAQRRCPRKDTRHRIEHFSMPTRDQVRRLGLLQALAVPQPHWLYEKGDTYVTAYGEERAGNFCPYAWFKRYGLPIIISSDAPVALPSAIHGIYAAVNRKTVNGSLIGPQHAITAEEAIEGYTINAARGIFMEDRIGSLEAGKYADFVVLDQNPLCVESEELIDIQVLETWAGGERIYEKR